MIVNIASPLYGSVQGFRRLDFSLYATVAILISVGIVMVASSSLDFAAERYHDTWFFVRKQITFLAMGLVGGLVILAVPMSVWNKYSGLLLILAFFLLMAVLIPGIGKVVNGSRRWLSLGPFSMQASEIAKFCLIVYFASYLARRNEELRTQWSGFLKLTAVLLIIVLLLLLEPDFGSSVVISATLGCMMFVAGVPLARFLLLAVSGVAGLALMAVASPYRWERLVAFMDPWATQFDSGYQLVQSLIAFGRGGWFGVGLGNSLQKLFFLPEAHTDFIFAIFTEEFGFIGAIALIGVFGFFLYRLVILFRRASEQEQFFSSYVVFGIGVMLAMQAFINMGVASGFLPTKGLTLPFISYGGSSLLITCGLMALVFRVNLELNRENQEGKP
ncbi:putative lipid II flippase FtsW [Saccharophagus degradans]|uniref:Probable peptidoglycan glycosyltransferase FtsW n=1 Tax=Saccharophagus degradans (strain 2-40 / ATCC 43961 / DSM 17024) TaxID=203122 RepID=FTSW_SACD2|nr:putative lipid II flippase FtsW [Saccharophagus degradans]Q21MH0.1 RecName: Full=Probable peptidoglycan glycosyltransferase FtsW; Short=PGT; AltName: Full=Cell division protein FtsW; AltName: Full=Cell wall polymerase; AltName: Full=Peptidoglycan polymerase; Short=PG polymerase [Saccharophagus degradans 2-40]ABD80109.1 cell cycle protein [Saccharophagus degradans 2-40]WGO97709.1 putative lipid II flippase FtsW [Saccharophagus degradans]